jgi:hypothetical protein
MATAKKDPEAALDQVEGLNEWGRTIALRNKVDGATALVVQRLTQREHDHASACEAKIAELMLELDAKSNELDAVHSAKLALELELRAVKESLAAMVEATKPREPEPPPEPDPVELELQQARNALARARSLLKPPALLRELEIKVETMLAKLGK